jgi:hypothetical protein
MKTSQKKWSSTDQWTHFSGEKELKNAQLVLAFGQRKVISEATQFDQIKKRYPKADIVLCSTAGEIIGTEVSDDSISVTAVAFKKTTVVCKEVSIKKIEQSYESGKKLASLLPQKGLTHALLFSDGISVNGTDVSNGVMAALPESVSVTGGLVGDGPDFKKTVLGLNEIPSSGKIVIVGLYGKNLKVGYGSLGGWDAFGPNRVITKSQGSTLFELDDKPALSLYKKYLGDQAKELPSSGLLFPLCLEINKNTSVVRTLLSVNEKEESMTFAGTMPEGVETKLMKANFERLVDGATQAAHMSLGKTKKNKCQLAILVSCIGRKLVLKERIEEEVEAVQSIIGEQTPMCGFYSYGEICPTSPTQNQCQLHNQTMTVTVFRES